MRTYDYHGSEVSLEKGTYRNGTVAMMLNETDGELYAVATVNLHGFPRREQPSRYEDGSLRCFRVLQLSVVYAILKH